jgi:hypothetical protein
VHEFWLTEMLIAPVAPELAGFGWVAEAEAVHVPAPVWVTVKVSFAIVTVPVREE